MHVLQNVQPAMLASSFVRPPVQSLGGKSAGLLCQDCFKGHPKPYADFMDWRFRRMLSMRWTSNG